MSRSIGSLFRKPGVGPKYRQHQVGLGFPVHDHHDQPKDKRQPILLGKGQKLDAQVTVHVRQFDLSVKEDLEKYTEVRDRIANRLFFQFDRQMWVCPTTGKMKMYMEWGEVQYLKPKEEPQADPEPAPPAHQPTPPRAQPF